MNLIEKNSKSKWDSCFYICIYPAIKISDDKNVIADIFAKNPPHCGKMFHQLVKIFPTSKPFVNIRLSTLI